MHAADDEGSVLPLAIVFMMLALGLVLVVTGATSLYLERQRLFTVAGGAALAGAEAFDLDSATVESGRVRFDLQDADVVAAVDAYLDEVELSGLEQVQVVRAVTPDGRSAEVQLAARWRPPVVGFAMPNGLTLDVTATARSVVG